MTRYQKRIKIIKSPTVLKANNLWLHRENTRSHNKLINIFDHYQYDFT